MKCSTTGCDYSGTIGKDITMHREGTVKGTQGMPRYVAFCPDHQRERAEKSKYHEASKGS